MKRIIPSLVLAVLVAGCASQNPEDTAKQYCTSLLEGDYVAFKALFTKEHKRYIHEDTFEIVRGTKCEVDSVSHPYVTIRYRLEDLPEGKGVLYILPDGRIKYDPIFCMHPALLLRHLLSQMENDDVRYYQNAYRMLKEWQLPLFGFKPDTEQTARKESVKAFHNWIEENESTFDIGEVKIPVSPTDQERMAKATHNN